MPAFDPDHWIKYCCVIDQWRRPTESILNSSRICHHFHSLEALWSSTTLCCYQMLQSIQLCALLYFLSDIRRSYRRHPWILRELSRRVVKLGHRRFRTDILGELVDLVKILCTVVYRLSDRRRIKNEFSRSRLFSDFPRRNAPRIWEYTRAYTSHNPWLSIPIGTLVSTHNKDGLKETSWSYS